MKKFSLVVGWSCLILLIVAPIGLKGGETKISMTLWNRYTAERSEGKFTKSAFTLERGYFGVEPTFTDRIKGRFTIDVFSSDKFADGAGLKLKYAYLNFTQVLPIPESDIQVGLLKHYFGTVYDWEYISIRKALEDERKVASSADYGLALFGYIPHGFGEYAISILNGEGYNKTGSALDKEPEIAGNLRVIPLPGLTIGGSILYENKESDRFAYVGVGRIARGPFEIWGEYLIQDKSDIKSNGWMIMPILKLQNLAKLDVDIIGRFDKWDGNTELENDGDMTITCGINWNLVRDEKNKSCVFLQIQGEKTIFENEAISDINQLLIQLQWKFSNTI
ncbi:MAG: hypothetical protein ABIN61_03570 [candidate division WOR-3 bacterium]